MVTFLSHFTPSMMPEDVIERIFVQREKLASRLVTIVRESVLGTAKHHTLIVGPRGIGKTHLASLVYHRVRGLPELTDQIRIAWLREEEWGIASFLDFVIRVLRALDEGYPEAGLAGRIENLFALKAERAEREAVALLDEFVANRTVFLITENLDQLFEGLDDVGQRQFRAYLQDRATWTILATAPRLFNGVSLQSSPFYGFFRVLHLKELSVDEAIELLQKIAELSGREELASFVRTPVGRARIRAVHHLAGGNHRIYVIFSEFLTRETLDELVDPFLTTMDHLTPYYQARMQSLSPQMRKIIDYLCEVRHAVPVKEIAQRCFVTPQTAASQLKILKERGFVRSFNVGRESHYELLEPLLRLSLEVKKQRGEPIRLFVDFLRIWYTKPELEQRLLTTQMVNSVDRDYFRRALQDWNRSLPVGEARLNDWFEQCLACIAEKKFAAALEFAESLVRVRGDSEDYVVKADCLVGLSAYEEAAVCAERALAMAPTNRSATLLLGYAQYKLGRFSDAVTTLNPAGFNGEIPAILWTVLSDALYALGHIDEALSTCENAVKLEPGSVYLHVLHAQMLRTLHRYEDALFITEASPELARDPHMLDTKAHLFTTLGRLEEAALTLRTAIETEESSQRRAQLGTVLILCGEFEEAQAELNRAVELNPEDPLVWIAHSMLHLERGDIEAALDMARRAEELAPMSGDLQIMIGGYLEAAGKSEEATKRYRRSMRLGAHEPQPYFRIAVTLATGGEWKEALSAIQTALVKFSHLADDFAAGVDLLEQWMLHRSQHHWLDELASLSASYAGSGALPLLSGAAARSLENVIVAEMEPARARAWADVWTSLSNTYPELDIGARLLRAGTEYHLTGDPRHLLELASEERAMVESIPGVRPLSELT